MKSKILTLLSRKTSSNYFLPEIDGFRFFAIFTVLLYHLNTHLLRVTGDTFDPQNGLSRVLSKGSVGVDVFFAISGFILALPFARHFLFQTPQPPLKSYYIRRLTRLEPPYVTSLVLLLAVHVVVLHRDLNDLLPNFLASLFYVHSIVYDQWSVINPVAWSLEVEVQFYLLAPFLAYVFTIRDATARRSVMVLIIAASIFHYNFNIEWIKEMHLRKSLLMHLHQFFAGFLFADIFLTTWQSKERAKSYWYDLIGVNAMGLLLFLNDPFNWLNDLLFVAALLIAFVCIFKGRLLNRFYTHPVIVIIGGMCYSIYLLHYALIAFLTERTGALIDPAWGYPVNYLIQGTLIIPLVLLVSAVFFALIERPCMDKDWPAKLKAKMISIFAPQAR